MSGLVAIVRACAGPLTLDLELSAAPGESVAVLGPNGSGKTTLLRCLAGLHPLEHGRVVLDGSVLEDSATGRFVPPESRGVAMVHQQLLLFPHMSVLDNVAFGLRAAGANRQTARRQALAWLERVDMAPRAGAKPGELSVGQAQRVALARALATERGLVLLDEPLAALDATNRLEMRRELKRHMEGRDCVRILVTHDPIDAAALADRLVVIEGGRIVQEGTTATISACPRSSYVADLVGLNLLRGRAGGGRVVLEGGTALIVVGQAAGDVFAVVHPRAVALHRDVPAGSPRNAWLGTADAVVPEGERARVQVGGPVPIIAEVTPAAVAELRLAEGGPVWVSVKATEIQLYPV